MPDSEVNTMAMLQQWYAFVVRKPNIKHDDNEERVIQKFYTKTTTE